MMKIKTHILYIAIITIISLVAVIGFIRPKKVIEVEKHSIDTLIVTKIDTVTYTKYEYIEKKVTDTIYFRADDYIEICDYRFSKKGAYDITASGYAVELKNVTVFPVTKTITVTNTVEREVYIRQWDLYAGLGIDYYGNEVIPSLKFAANTPNDRWLFGANIGYASRKPILGVFVAYNLLKKDK